MEKYTYNFSLTADSKAESLDKMKSLKILAERLNAKELQQMANILEHDPVKTSLAKKYLF